MKTFALAFSGGKDSMACWFLSRHLDPYVIWVNTGKVYPETMAVVDLVRAQTSKFIEVKTNQLEQNARCGLPSEIVPIDSTVFGMNFTGEKSVLVQSYLDCCFENISGPLHSAAKQLGVDELIRGQRNDEGHKSTARDGAIVDGITYSQPIENWSKDEVMRFLAQHMEIPEHFALDHSSMDCYDCTAFLAHSKDRAEWTRVRHPELHTEYMARMRALKAAVSPSFEALNDLLKEVQ